MTETSSFYTQVTSSTAPVKPLGTTTGSSPLLATGVLGGFLDLLMATLAPTKDPSAVKTPPPGVLLDKGTTDTTDQTASDQTDDQKVDPLLALLTTPIVSAPQNIVPAATEAVMNAVVPTAEDEIISAAHAAGATQAVADVFGVTNPPKTANDSSALLSSTPPTTADIAVVATTPTAGVDTTPQAAGAQTTPEQNAAAGENLSALATDGITIEFAPTKDTTKDADQKGSVSSIIDSLVGNAANDDIANSYRPSISTTVSAQATVSTDKGGANPLPHTHMTHLDAGTDVGLASLTTTTVMSADSVATASLSATGTTNSPPQAGTGTSASHGGSPTQQVAAQIQLMGQSRDVQTLTVQLNPPELGKVQVKMSYGRDKSVKADVMVEKSETLSLIQRDADTLRQALNNAGLSADAGSLNFSLADPGAFANQMYDQGSSGGHHSGSGQDQATEDVAWVEIKPSEEWSVDSKTGIVRYNIVV